MNKIIKLAMPILVTVILSGCQTDALAPDGDVVDDDIALSDVHDDAFSSEIPLSVGETVQLDDGRFMSRLSAGTQDSDESREFTRGDGGEQECYGSVNCSTGVCTCTGTLSCCMAGCSVAGKFCDAL